MPDGCIFVTVKGAGVGTLFDGIACAIGRDVYAYLPSAAIEYHFALASLQHTVLELKAQARGSIPGLSKEHLADHPISLPPLDEQRRIMEKLDSLTAASAECRAAIAHVESLIERYRLAVMHTAFDPARNSVVSPWTIYQVQDIGDVALGRQRSPKDHHGPHMRPYLRAANITWQGLDLTDVKQMNFTPSEFEVFRLEPGDVLVNEGSGSAKEVGKPAIWRGEMDGCCFQNTTIRVRPHRCSPEYLYYYFLFCARSMRFAGETQGVNIHHIGKKGLAEFPIPLPDSEDRQAKIVARIEEAFAQIDSLAAATRAARERLDTLDRAVLAKAFRGELVPQDPNDEPASELLKRTKGENT